ncbi:MAG: hypothetical protein JWM74_1709, partial [Myxococcaceae bacterium]|nr:hypothetical protein [Myxococcaceae bacterium]
MNRPRLGFLISWPILVAALASPLLMNCGAGGAGGPTIPGGGGLPGVPGACPDLASASAVAKLDFASEFKIEAKSSAKLKAGLQAAAELKEFA